jgi:enoyl-CoA hydratase
MMSYRHILFDTDDKGIALITVNRPEKRNALSAEVVEELHHAFTDAAREPSVRAMIVTGSGEKAFVAGADINELAALSPNVLREKSLRGQAAFRILEECGKPSVAAVNGYALGGGMELAMACTVRFASGNAMLGQPEVKLGLIPGYGGTLRLPRLVGRGVALEMLLSGEPVSAAEAHRIGLVNAVVPQADLLNHSREWLAKVLANAPIALRLVMETVDAGLNSSLDAGLRLEATAFAAAAATEDRNEGTHAFLEKRRAAFAGK